MLDIIYEDDFLVAIYKPCGLLVHRSKIALDADEFAVQILRDQLNQYVYPAHRLDRKTSGVLLFSKDEHSNREMQMQFMQQEVKKTYLSIVRGYTEDKGIIDYALTKDDGKIQEAVTHYRTLEKVEVDVPLGKFSTSRYSLVEVIPETGRMHQIR
ncbi:MAG: pseudouridine synthase, partial [Crocinitomicaceae bacterium]|nr:pseudouridine synthase [Crocinitomicaceae bacterium]